ncbi:MAG: YraN family protein [Lachnospiraceae bacterium]|nr:YraN family protein [Lachnospiraceae bacterium]MBQ8627525.1 YraN family protein [Agathobacter sp.]
MQNNRTIGAEYEERAVAYLEQQGMQILERNFRSRKGEIDIIAKDGEYTVFVEVKYRSSEQKGAPSEAVTLAKQKTICRVADFYRMKHGLGEFAPIRYDVVACSKDEVMWYPNAFAHRY